MSSVRLIVVAALVVICGCASPRRPVTARSTTGPVATRPIAPEALLSLDEIEPRPVLAVPKPATASARPPLDAIELYARAREATLANQRYTGINLLEKALQIDPDSFELNYSLGQAYLGVGGGGEQAIAAFDRAASIDANKLEVQVELGRAYQARGDLVRAIWHFRLAAQTDEYRDDRPLAAVVDYRLAVALQQKGYDRAALECYDRLIDRLQHPGSQTRNTPEIGYLLTRPQLLYEQIGRLHEKHGRYEQALRAYQVVAQHTPGDFDNAARVVEMLLMLRRDDQAIDAAAELVRRFHASNESLELLRDAYRRAGRESAFADELAGLHRQHPGDRAILLALADTLAASGQLQEARQLLHRAVCEFNGDLEIVRRLFDLYADRDEVAAAARLIVQTSADHPDSASELLPLFADLMRLSRRNALRLPTLQKLAVPDAAQAAKDFWIWRMASAWTRPATARAALDRSAKANLPFDPACRALLDSYLSRSDWDEPAKARAADTLIDMVRSRGREDLAEELRGMVLLRGDESAAAASAFGRAVKLSRRPSPDLQLAHAIAALRSGNPARFEQLMWKLISDRPRFGPGYQILLQYFNQNGAHAKASNLVSAWLAADPNGAMPRIARAAELLNQRHAPEAQAVIRKLFEQRPDDGEVVTALVLIYTAAGQQAQVIELLEAERTAHPANRVAVEALVEVYGGQQRLADAARVLDAARAAIGNDPDLLYYVAHLHQQIDQQQTSEQILQQVLDLDPTHAPAGNDLGYTWADAGKNLDRAEAMIRMAVDAEPDNPSYIDSLGWVMYKRGRFEEARRLLTQAAEPLDQADPVVLDHLGDALYRAGELPPAQQMWQRSLERLDHVGARNDLKNLRPQLQTKLRQAASSQPVSVAPVVESAGGKDQAKN